MATKTSATIRMYRLNELGDCFLISFSVSSKKSHMLIDCGSFRNGPASVKRLKEITAQIKKDIGTSARIDVIVGTHQHNDHLSGFVHCKNDFNAIKVDQVWLSWLDDPDDPEAKKIGQDYNNLRLNLHKAMAKMRGRADAARPASRTAASLNVVSDMLGFFGADEKTPPELPRDATQILKKLGTKDPRYLEPSDVVDMPGLPNGAVRIHVLGPPRNEKSLYRKDPRKGESYDHALASATRVAASMLRALDKQDPASATSEINYPFSAHHKLASGNGSKELSSIEKSYRHQAASWRTIDDAWLEQAGSLALWLDGYTNNSSLVLAIELVESGKVLLFAADAQTGNWSSWNDVAWKAGHPGTASLLQRTAFYKVGHHGSHNSTLKLMFEQIGGADATNNLCALIPVHKKDPNITKKNGWKMPADKLFTRIVERTSGRVLQMDNVDPPESNLTSASVKAAWKKAGISPKVTANSIQLTIK